MPKKMSMQQRLVEFGLNASPNEIESAIDTLKACLDARSPKPAKKKRTRGQTATAAVAGASDTSSSAS